MPLTSTLFKKSVVFLFLVFLLLPHSLLAQSVYFDPAPGRLNKVNDTILRHKHFGRAAIEFGVAELIPFSYDHWIAKKDYANISLKTIGHNFEPNSWTWDNDPFETNQFGHPYHGSYFFSTMRTNGYTFWQSVPAAFAGSYLWESFAENQPPAPNDFINTSFGGIILGEMTYRVSNKIVNNQATGMHRQISEVIALLVNPTNGLNRILDGKWGKVYGNSAQHDSTKINAQFDLGFREFNVNNNNPFHKTEKGLYGHLRLLYGVPDEDYKTPFSNIMVNVEIGKDDSTAFNIVSVYGSLVGWDFSMEGHSQQLLVLSANYDYIHNASFFYGGQSVKLNLISKYHIDGEDVISTSFGVGPVLLAAVPDPYLYRGRNYDYGSGLGLNGSGSLNISNKLLFTLSYRGGWVTTISGNKSDYFLHTASSELSYAIMRKWDICAELGYFALQGNYRNYPDRDDRYPYFKTALRYNLDF